MSNPDSEKQEPVVVVQAISPVSDGSVDNTSGHAPWKSGIRKRFPWVGLGAITVIILCTIATLLVLKSSEKQPAWRWCRGWIEPNVFLSIFNNLTNIAITLAVADGIAIAWWRRALAGQTVEQLHYSWSFSMSFTSIFLKFRYFNVIALAALAAKIAVIDAVLFQRSLGTNIATDGTPVKTNSFTFASQAFPFTASMGPTSGSIDTIQPAFVDNLNEWLTNPSFSTVLNSIYECDAYYCRFAVPAAGFSVDCTSSKQEVDYKDLASKALASNQSSGYQNLPVFSTDWSFVGSDVNNSSASILLHTTYAYVATDENDDKNGTCRMNLTTIDCTLKPAVLSYTVLITNQNSAIKANQKKDVLQNNTQSTPISESEVDSWNNDQYDAYASLSLSCNDTLQWCGAYNRSWRQLAGVQVVKSVNVTEPFIPYAQSTLYGFYLAFKYLFTSSATMNWDGKTWSHIENGSLAYKNRDTQAGSPQAGCYLGYNDPRKFIFERMNLLTLSVATDPYSYYDWNPNLTGNSTDPIARDLFYSTNENYTDLFNKKHYSAKQILEALVDTTNPGSGFDPELAVLQPITMKRGYKAIHYMIDWKYAYGAIAATVLVILCIIPVYWKFWDLGRKVTLGPFEIANAFQSPALSGVSSSLGEMDLVLKQIGKNKVRYVEVTDDAGRKYAFQSVQS